MARNFPNWLKAYEDFSDDGFTPAAFNKWVGISILAAALERKVWMPLNPTYEFYPNLFVLLVGHPGTGKSTTLGKGADLLREVDDARKLMNLIPAKVTEAALITAMRRSTTFQIGNFQHTQSAGYYQASEASNSLRDIFGPFINTITELYDCGKLVEKQTEKAGRVTIHNVCFNLIACATFSYLGELISDANVMGGFASRLIYVVQKKSEIAKRSFGTKSTAEHKQFDDYRKALIEDLSEIHRLAGPFKGSPEFYQGWENFDYDFRTKHSSVRNEKLASLTTRTFTNTTKLSMILSAAESNSLVLECPHLEEAKELIEGCNADIPEVFRMSKALDTKTQSGLNYAVFDIFKKEPEMTMNKLRGHLLMRSFNPMMTENALKAYLASGLLSHVGNDKFKFLGNADDYL